MARRARVVHVQYGDRDTQVHTTIHTYSVYPYVYIVFSDHTREMSVLLLLRPFRERDIRLRLRSCEV